MGRFVEGEDRRQSLLLPASLDDYVTEDNPVRVVDVFIEELDLGALGFAGMQPAATGRPAYHPSTLLKIYALPDAGQDRPWRWTSRRARPATGSASGGGWGAFSRRSTPRPPGRP